MDSEVRSKSDQEAMDWEPSSEDLTVKTARGDEIAFKALVNRHQTSILNLIYRFIGDRPKGSRSGSRSFPAGLAGGQKLQTRSQIYHLDLPCYCQSLFQ